MRLSKFRTTFRAQSGVTLVEVIIVIAVAGILAAISAPSIFGAIRRERAKQVASSVANQLREARNQAMARGEALRVVIETSPDGADWGRVEVQRTITRDVTGAFTGDPCDPDDLDSCPEGQQCVRATNFTDNFFCWSVPARSCRELDATYNIDAVYASGDLALTPVADYTPQGNSAEVVIRRAYGSNIGSSGNLRAICFNPDGRVEGVRGGVVTSEAPVGCDTDNLILTVAHRDASEEDVADALACDAPGYLAEQIDAYAIRVQHNGEIMIRRPTDG